MPNYLHLIEELIYQGPNGLRRFTQDSPVYPDVWLKYAEAARNERIDLLLTPTRGYPASKLLYHLRNRLEDPDINIERRDNNSKSIWKLAGTGSTVAACLGLDEMIRCALPMTRWWQEYIKLEDSKPTSEPNHDSKPTSELKWFIQIVCAINWHNRRDLTIDDVQKFLNDNEKLQEFYHTHRIKENVKDKLPRCLWSISRNREAFLALTESVPATKADASRRLFDIDGSLITWAIIDSGIDARHKAFRIINPKGGKPFQDYMEKRGNRNTNHTRITATYDFSKFRDLMIHINDKDFSMKSESETLLNSIGPSIDSEGRPLTKKEITDLISEVEKMLKNGRTIDWSTIAPLLSIPHNKDDYIPPRHTHGTHVAGILGADMRPWEKPNRDTLVGMCPGIKIYDLRVMGSDGKIDEFSILAALQFVRWLNDQRDGLVIHGVNISISMYHDVKSYACGRTPACDECDRLVAEGTVVVVAAGNEGRAVYQSETYNNEGFRALSITDPGNSESVITVGSTHRDKPHTYGVSYFSSRGPTGDGRFKPDILAPGEKIVSTVIGDDFEKTERMDGTSMAAPHVSGAAALLISKHKELIGQPMKVKEVLCKSAVDLGRERYFQGHGMVDVLRALQSL